MSKEDKIEKRGTVLKKLPNQQFRVEVNSNGKEILGILSGNMRQNHIDVLPGDEVTLEFSPYDLEKAYITYRHS